MLVMAGKPVDATIDLLLEHMVEGDIIIDGGNEWCAPTNWPGPCKLPHHAPTEYTESAHNLESHGCPDTGTRTRSAAQPWWPSVASSTWAWVSPAGRRVLAMVSCINNPGAAEE